MTPGPCYLLLSPSLIPVLDSNSVSGRSGAALISSARSHLRAALSLSLSCSLSLYLPQLLPCHLFFCGKGQRTSCLNSISDILGLQHRTEPSPCVIALPGMRQGRVFTAGTLGLYVLRPADLNPSFAPTSLHLNRREGLSRAIHF